MSMQYDGFQGLWRSLEATVWHASEYPGCTYRHQVNIMHCLSIFMDAYVKHVANRVSPEIVTHPRPTLHMLADIYVAMGMQMPDKSKRPWKSLEDVARFRSLLAYAADVRGNGRTGHLVRYAAYVTNDIGGLLQPERVVQVVSDVRKVLAAVHHALADEVTCGPLRHLSCVCRRPDARPQLSKLRGHLLAGCEDRIH